MAQIDPLLSSRLTKRWTALPLQLEKASREIALRWGIVLQDYEVEEARSFLSHLKFDTAGKRRICLLVDRGKEDLPTDVYALRKMAGELGVDAVEQLIVQQEILRENSPFQETKIILEEILKKNDCLTLKELAVDGQALMEEGFVKGKMLGEVLCYLLDQVHQNPKNNDRIGLLAMAKKRFGIQSQEGKEQ